MKKRAPLNDEPGSHVHTHTCQVCGGSGRISGFETYPPEYLDVDHSPKRNRAPEYERVPRPERVPQWVTCRHCKGTGVYPPERAYEGERFYH